MIVQSASLRIALDSLVSPDAGTNGALVSGGLAFSASVTEQFSAATNVIAARIWFGASGATAQSTFDPVSGFTIAAGMCQVETATVTAAAGCTTAGNLALTFTAAILPGSPVSLNVALTPTAHPTAASIATAIAAALNAHTASGFPLYFTAAATGAAVAITSIYPAANDTTLNLAITAGLGVSAVTSSTNTVAGVAGARIDEPAGSNLDSFGKTIAFNTVDVVLLKVSGTASVYGASGSGFTALPTVKPGKCLLWDADAFEPTLAFEANGRAIADILILGY